jgi:hypothetical protein
VENYPPPASTGILDPTIQDDFGGLDVNEILGVSPKKNTVDDLGTDQHDFMSQMSPNYGNDQG